MLSQKRGLVCVIFIFRMPRQSKAVQHLWYELGSFTECMLILACHTPITNRVIMDSNRHTGAIISLDASNQQGYIEDEHGCVVVFHFDALHPQSFANCLPHIGDKVYYY